jgi:hypothetical protein
MIQQGMERSFMGRPCLEGKWVGVLIGPALQSGVKVGLLKVSEVQLGPYREVIL